MFSPRVLRLHILCNRILYAVQQRLYMYMYSYSNCDDKRNNKQSLKCLGVIAYLARIRTITCIPKSYYVGIVASQLLVQLL